MDCDEGSIEEKSISSVNRTNTTTNLSKNIENNM